MTDTPPGAWTTAEEAEPSPTAPPSRADVASAWTDVADVVDEPDGSADELAQSEAARRSAVDLGHRPADLSAAMTSLGARRDLRRVMIAYGAIGKARSAGESGTPAVPEDVVGAFITAPATTIEQLLRAAGAISDEERIARFVANMARAGARCDPADPASVLEWITTMGAILRDDPGA